MSKVRLAFIGVGGMGQCAHLKNYATLQDCEIAAICEVKEEQAKAVAARYAIPKIYKDYRLMIKEQRPDALVAIQPFTRHGSLIPDLLGEGIPVITEKPIAGSVEMGERILKASKAKGAGKLFVAYHKRSDPATMLAKDEIAKLKASGELGKMTYVRHLMPAGDWVASGFNELICVKEEAKDSFKTDPPPSDMDEETAKAYTAFVNYYIHQVNLVRHILGESWKVDYAGRSGALLAGESASGVACSIEMSPYRTTIDWQESVLICFERGWLKLELPAPMASNRPGALTIFRDPGNGVRPSFETPQLPWVHAMRQQALNYLAAVRGEPNPLCGAVDALEDIKLAREYIRIWKGK